MEDDYRLTEDELHRLLKRAEAEAAGSFVEHHKLGARKMTLMNTGNGSTGTQPDLA